MSEIREISPEDAKYIDPNLVQSMRLSDGTTVVVNREGSQNYYQQTQTQRLCPRHSQVRETREEVTTETTTNRGNYAGVVEERRNYQLYESGVTNAKKEVKEVVRAEPPAPIEYCTCAHDICPCCGRRKRTTTTTVETYEPCPLRTREVKTECYHCPKCHKNIAGETRETREETSYVRTAPVRQEYKTTSYQIQRQTEEAPLRNSQTKTFISEYVQPKYTYAEQEFPARQTRCKEANCQYCGRSMAEHY